MPIIKKFCCCCTLRMGCIVNGILGLANCLVNLDAISYSKSNFDCYDDAPAMYSERSSGSHVIVTLMFAVTNGMLIYGAYKGKRMYLLPWLVLDMVIIVIAAIIIVFSGLWLTSRAGGEGGIILGIGLPLIALAVYFWLSVFSLYQELEEQEAQPQLVVVMTPKPTDPTYEAYDAPLPLEYKAHELPPV